MGARGSKGSVAPGDFEAAEPSAGSADDVAARDGGSQHAAGMDAAGEGEALRPVRNHAYRNVARVTGKTGKQGEVRVEPIDGLPFLLREGLLVHLTPPPLEGIRSSVVEGVREMGDGWAVKFADARSSEDAFSLVGRLCLVAEADLPALEPEDDPWMLVGLQVVDEEAGALGEVTDLLMSSEQITLVVGDAEEPDRYLIPFVEEFVTGFDDEYITIKAPKGLLDL